jgi:hypothetical protein
VADIEVNPLDTAALVRVALVGVVGLVVTASAAYQGVRVLGIARSLPRPAVWALAFSLLSLVSTLWSVYPAWTFYRAAEYLLGIGLVFFVTRRMSNAAQVRRLWDITWLLQGVLFMSVWVGVIVTPELALRYPAIGSGIPQLTGVWPSVAANGVGDLGAVLGVICLSRFLAYKGGRLRLLWLGGLGISLLSLFLSQTRSAWLGFALAVPALLVAYQRFRLLAGGAVLLAGAAVLFPAAQESAIEYFRRGQPEGLIWSLSGRVEYWQQVLASVSEHPLGLGAWAGDRFGVFRELYGEETTVSSVHSAWFSVLAGLGWPGLALLAAMVLSLWISATRIVVASPSGSLGRQLGAEALGILSVATARSIFTPRFVWHPAMDVLALLALCIVVERQRAFTSYPTNRAAIGNQLAGSLGSGMVSKTGVT